MEVWHIVQDPPCRWRALDDELVVYHTGSGNTHRLDPLQAELFEALMAAPASLAALKERIAHSFEIEIDGPTERRLEAALRQLRSFGLIEPSP